MLLCCDTNFEITYNDPDDLFPAPNGLNINWDNGNWFQTVRVGANMYFYSNPGFDFSIRKQFKKIGKFGIYNSINTEPDDIDGIFGSTKSSGKGYCFFMTELSTLGYDYTFFEHIKLDASINPGLCYDVYGKSDIHPYIRIPIKISLILGNFELGTSFDSFAAKEYESDWELTNNQIFMSYKMNY